ncbi:MAG: glycosyltransferase, partial [Rikenella sp.]|nr:glycosyltransferase [Rikenella sp.]
MKISVIIPVYNIASWIEACLRSVFDQAEAGTVELECIVVDDGRRMNRRLSSNVSRHAHRPRG